MLWTDKYTPQSTASFVGNSKAVETVREFLSRPARGAALLLAGPPGVGKSLLPRLLARELQLYPVELDASDERGKDDIEAYASATKTQTLFARGKVLIIDEVDGLAAGDRGGISAIASLIKQSRIPLVLICTDAYNPKLRPVRALCDVVKFTKIPSPSVEKFLREVCKKEGITASDGLLKSLARFSQGDLRAALTDLQMATAGSKTLEGAAMESVGFRERESSLYDTIPTIFRSRSLVIARKMVWDGDKDPDEVFWWLEHNIPLEHTLENIPILLDILARADVFRGRVVKQQNWSFKGYMVDMMAGVTIYGTPSDRYVPFKAPDRLLLLGRSKQERALRDALAHKMGRELHCSKKRILADVLPYMRFLIERGHTLGLAEEDLALFPKQPKKGMQRTL